jgi:O-antigen ligase
VTGTFWRPRWYVWAIGGSAALAALLAVRPALAHGPDLGITAVGVLILVLAVAVLWELPPAVMGCGAIALSVFSGNWSKIGLPGFPFLPDRLLLVGMLVAVVLRSPGAKGLPHVRVRGVHLLMALVVLYAVASGVVDGTLAHRSPLFDLLDRLGAIPFVMLLVAPSIFAGERERNWLLATLVGLGGYLGLTAILEVIGPHALVFPHYIDVYDQSRGGGQAGGPFSSVVTEGFACYACAVAAAIAFFRWRSTHWRAVAAAVVLLSLFGSFLSLERGVWIGVVAGSVAAAVATSQGRRLIVPGALAGATILAATLLIVPSLSGNTNTRLNDRLPVWDRLNQTSAALRMVEAHPLVGVGWDNYANRGLDYFRQASGYPMTGFPTSRTVVGDATGRTSVINFGGVQGELHDSYLSYAVELGLVGLSLWLAVVAWGLSAGILRKGGPPDLSAWRRGLLAVGVCFLALCFFDPLSQNFTELLLWTWAGVAVANTERIPAPGARQYRSRGLSMSGDGAAQPVH